jgi:DNA-binding transcriptional ArsR family regulator
LAIRFHLPALAPERIAFGYSPLLEAVLSLHVLVAPKHHPVQHEWVRAMRALPSALKRRIGEFGFAYGGYPPDFLFPPAQDPYRDFGEELRLFAGLDPTTLALEFLRPMWDHQGRRDPALLARDDVRSHVAKVGARMGASEALLDLLFDDAPELARRFADLLSAYWEDAFSVEWMRLEPRLAEAVSEAGREIAGDGVYSFLQGLPRQLRIDPAREEFGKDVPHEHRVEVTEENQLVLVPSAFAWPHVWLNCDAPWPLAIVYPAPFVAEDARPRIPSADLVRVLRAAGDDVRLRGLKLIAERPRSTQELAPLVGISEAGLSKHLRMLAEAGLVTTRREGYYVLYSLVPDRVDAISPALQSFLASRA